jgi:hypothetical protein
VETDVFFERRENIFLQPQVSTIAGLLSVPYANMGIMENRRFEITGEYQKVLNHDFTLSVRGNYTFARNKIVKNRRFYSLQ